MYRKLLFIILLFVSAAAPIQIKAFSLALDSVATWGRFPKLCVDVYRWGDRTFNSYDSTYVVGTGKKFNIKFKTDTWLDYYSFDFENDTHISMISSPSTSLGVWLTYLAVSAGYDVNVSKYFNGGDRVRKRFNFQFNCSLFAADIYYLSNDVNTRINSFGPKDNPWNPDLKFYGIDNKTYGIDTYYFFNHKKYSQGAAFNYSKLQRRSAGSFYAGLSIWLREYSFDFNELPDEMKQYLPTTLPGYKYSAKSNNYAFKLGYGYNWVLSKKWLIGASVAPCIGFRYGYICDPNDSRYSFSFYNKARLSVIFNNRDFFMGIIGKQEMGIRTDNPYTLLDMALSIEASVGFRFNLW